MLFFTATFLIINCLVHTGCILKESGCIDETARNYNPDARKNDGSCVYDWAVPRTYQFERVSESSVAYGAQTLQQILIEDWLIYLNNLSNGRASTADLATYYTSAKAQDNILTTLSDFALQQVEYDELATSPSLRANIDNSFQADSMILAWLDTIRFKIDSLNLIGTESHMTTQNLDIQAAIHPTLLGTVLYTNAVSNLMNIANEDNNSVVAGNVYTAQEHAWDEVMGYFGAARNYIDFEDADFSDAAAHYQDTDGNGFIDLTTEYNFSFARLANQRDAANLSTDFTNALFTALLTGRTAISNKNDTLLMIQSEQLLENWEKVIAATVVHHLNKTRTAIQQSQSTDFAREWSAMWGYIQALQYNDMSNFVSLPSVLEKIGSAPPPPTEYNAYLTTLEEVATALQNAYNFSDEQMNNW